MLRFPQILRNGLILFVPIGEDYPTQCGYFYRASSGSILFSSFGRKWWLSISIDFLEKLLCCLISLDRDHGMRLNLSKERLDEYLNWFDEWLPNNDLLEKIEFLPEAT